MKITVVDDLRWYGDTPALRPGTKKDQAQQNYPLKKIEVTAIELLFIKKTLKDFEKVQEILSRPWTQYQPDYLLPYMEPPACRWNIFRITCCDLRYQYFLDEQKRYGRKQDGKCERCHQVIHSKYRPQGCDDTYFPA